MKMQGRIHSVETMGSVDGPGLRYIVFFQGCNMKCLYCHNRDTWDCKGGELYNLDDIYNKIESLKGFYLSDSGGVTASGGEPLLQSEFVLELFKRVHKLSLTTALDTSGHVLLSDTVKGVLSETDYLLFDIKSLDNKIHKKLVGVDRSLVLKFIEYIKSADINIWLRYVYVPGYTDSKEDLIRLVEFINSMENVSRIDILPYHDLGKSKWEELGYKYPLKDLPIPGKEEVDKFKSYIKEHSKVIVK